MELYFENNCPRPNAYVRSLHLALQNDLQAIASYTVGNTIENSRLKTQQRNHYHEMFSK